MNFRKIIGFRTRKGSLSPAAGQDKHSKLQSAAGFGDGLPKLDSPSFCRRSAEFESSAYSALAPKKVSLTHKSEFIRMNFRRYIWLTLSAVALTGVMVACTVKYSLSGASISPLAKTVSISYFNNNATMVSPILSPTFTDALKERFQRQTRLLLVPEGGDLHFEGEITNYTSVPSQTSGSEYTVRNRLTITVMVRFTNSVEPQYNFSRQFSAFEDYDTSVLLQDAEVTLIPEIVDKLVNDIFNAAVSNW